MAFGKLGEMIEKQHAVYGDIGYAGCNRLDLVIKLMQWVFETVTFLPHHLGPVINIVSTKYFARVLIVSQ